MAWSTRELAELANIKVSAIRHYHRIGLLKEPARQYNGYKKYGVLDLVRVLHIRRLADLGVPLSQIDELTDDRARAPDVLRGIDAELALAIERIQRTRADIAAMLPDSASVDVPAGFEPIASRLSAADRALLHIYTQLYDDAAMSDLLQMMKTGAGSVDDDIEALPADADEATRQSLAKRLAPIIAESLNDYPWLSDPATHLLKSEQVTRETFIKAILELYNPAQLDVLKRGSILAHEQVRAMREANEDAE
ncbi:MerR family transcriptional regulator [Nocardiopsis sediminis]|uniref:MerR family transcriptional regulator n=1 Tax=Nocardiopsis sediminis TaxID=1778267 RepID=A0ABV8FKR0_9ACTN